MGESWSGLAVGDRIRMFRMPTEFSETNYYLHEDTRLLYEHLISTGARLTINNIDESGLPWVDYLWVREREGFHSLAINHDGWERVPPKIKWGSWTGIS
jgi:hypothetical protein